MPAIKPHSTATTNTPWDVRANEARIKTPVTESEATHFYAWYDDKAADPDGDGWPDAKSAYKFGHHIVGSSGVGGAANLKACSGAIAVLNGARGGANIPDADRQGVYDHVAKHLTAGGMKPPPLGASPEDSEAFCAEVDTRLAEDAAATARAAGGVTVSADELPPLLTPLGHSAWAIRRDVLPQLLSAHRAYAGGKRGDLESAAVSKDRKKSARRLGTSQKRASGAVAVICLTGPITPRASFLSMLFGGGGGGLEGFRENFREAVASPDVGAIVLDIDSPGGLVSLVPETAAEIREARGTKPIIAVSNTLCASAAYWLAAQADEIVCTPSGEVGSVGVYMVHEDWSGWNDAKGIVPQYISAGKYKTEGNPDEPLGEEGTRAWQQEVDDIYAAFVEGVAQGRGVTADMVRANYGEGRCVLAARALSAGLVDRVAPIQDVISELLGQETGAGSQLPNGAIGGAYKPAKAGQTARAADDPDDTGDGGDGAGESEDGPEVAESEPETDEAVSDAEARRLHAELLLLG